MEKQQYKIVLLGSSNVGKTSIAERLLRDSYNDNRTPTIGASYSQLVTEINGKKIKFDVWDTAGQERYNSLLKMYYRGADLILLVFDVSDLQTINKMRNYMDEIVQYQETKYIIIGNKVDLNYNILNVKKNVDKIINDNVASTVFVSAKTGANINVLMKQIIEHFKVYIKEIENKTVNPVGIDLSELTESKKSQWKFSYC